LTDYRTIKAIDGDVKPVAFFSSTLKSNKRFDFAKRCRSGKRSAFGFVQSNPFINRLTQLRVDGLFVAAMYSAKHKAGAATNVALIFFTPGNNFHVAIRCLAHD
jgi:hypothetical protein